MIFHSYIGRKYLRICGEYIRQRKLVLLQFALYLQGNRKKSRMKKFTLIIAALLLAAALLIACEKEKEEPIAGIPGISVVNFPKMDGSTSNEPLMRIVAYKLLGYSYKWGGEFPLRTVYSEDFPNIYSIVNTSQTHYSIINLLDGTADVVFSARTMSPDEQQYADSVGVSLIATPIALDAFVFLANAKNPVSSLTHDQVRGIYTGQHKRWSEVGGSDSLMHPYVRNQNSGSQELMESLVMKETPIADFEVDYEPTIFAMGPVYSQLTQDENGLCYTVYYFHEKMVPGETKKSIKTLEINGVNPSPQSIKSGTYPYVAPVYAMIRSNLDKSSMAYKLYEWLQTAEGKRVIAESGYVTE